MHRDRALSLGKFGCLAKFVAVLFGLRVVRKLRNLGLQACRYLRLRAFASEPRARDSGLGFRSGLQP